MNDQQWVDEIREQVKLLAGILDNQQDQLIELIVNESHERILAYINAMRVQELPFLPSSLDWLVRDVSMKRFNRLNAEGTTAHGEDGLTFDWEHYLDEYAPLLLKFADKPEDKSKSGVWRVW